MDGPLPNRFQPESLVNDFSRLSALAMTRSPRANVSKALMGRDRFRRWAGCTLRWNRFRLISKSALRNQIGPELGGRSCALQYDSETFFFTRLGIKKTLPLGPSGLVQSIYEKPYHFKKRVYEKITKEKQGKIVRLSKYLSRKILFLMRKQFF